MAIVVGWVAAWLLGDIALESPRFGESLGPWTFLLVGYAVTVAIETPILVIGLSKRHTFSDRLFAGAWLTACTYPIVVIVLPYLMASSTRDLYLVVAELFAVVAECGLFYWAIHSRQPEAAGSRDGKQQGVADSKQTDEPAGEDDSDIDSNSNSASSGAKQSESQPSAVPASQSVWRDFAVIAAANAASCLFGLWWFS